MAQKEKATQVEPTRVKQTKQDSKNKEKQVLLK